MLVARPNCVGAISTCKVRSVNVGSCQVSLLQGLRSLREGFLTCEVWLVQGLEKWRQCHKL